MDNLLVLKLPLKERKNPDACSEEKGTSRKNKHIEERQGTKFVFLKSSS